MSYIDFVQVGRMLPFEDKSFDLIVSRDVTWTLTEPEKQLKHWAEKLKVGGTMLYFLRLRSTVCKMIWPDYYWIRMAI